MTNEEIILRWKHRPKQHSSNAALSFTRYSGCAGCGAVLVVSPVRCGFVGRKFPGDICREGVVATLGGARPTNGSDRGCARSELIR